MTALHLKIYTELQDLALMYPKRHRRGARGGICAAATAN